jgi:hypothetical protein
MRLSRRVHRGAHGSSFCSGGTEWRCLSQLSIGEASLGAKASARCPKDGGCRIGTRNHNDCSEGKSEGVERRETKTAVQHKANPIGHLIGCSRHADLVSERGRWKGSEIQISMGDGQAYDPSLICEGPKPRNSPSYPGRCEDSYSTHDGWFS